ncbi:intein C-terminal splicing region [Chryseobacterium takakiae]|uniref:Intein C-terminal splicing region n=1 Tax=Chryseobacterium takakiae TaxID=1302685 RepID=A0A1M4UH54_9FLAO|nr:intein C-terminal splicing region [Chryseobacterium takakiae]
MREVDQNVKVYNFEVEDNHNYYISESKVLVHNSCEWKTVLHPGSLEKTIEKTWGKNAVKTFDNVIEQLASGKAGKNVHNLGGELKGYKAIDLAGTGSGRGAGRIIFKETSEQVEIVGAVIGHDYTKIIK